MKKLESQLREIIKKGKERSILIELDTKSYLETNIKTVRLLQKNGFSGVYISIQRPFNNISSLLKKQGVNLNQIRFIDVASAAAKIPQEKCKGCVHVSSELAVDELVNAIYTALESMPGKKFIFIDSFTTFALYKPVSEILRFSEFLMRKVKDEKEILLILNVAKDLSHKQFIRNVIVRADRIIEVKA